MTVNRTTLLDLPLPVTGTEAGTWGDTTNNGLSQYMDIAIAGMNSLTSANFTAGALTIANTQGDSSATNIAAGSAQYATIKVSSLAVNSTITAPSSNRSYRIINADATYSLTIKASGQTGVTFLPGQTGVVAFNGTDYVIVGVVGAGTATDNAVARFDGTTGEIIQNSVVTIADSTGDVAGVGTLTMGGNLTLNGGTANGVLYLNGSKVATSGSALTFDGTTFQYTGAANFATSTGNVGIGVTSPGTKLDVRAAAGSGGLITLVNTTAFANTNVIETSYTLNNSATGLATAAVIGVTNPAATGNSYGDIYFKTTNPTSGMQERMRLDSSGNLGLGVTPSAWGSGSKSMELPSGVALSSLNGYSIVFNNAYYNGSSYVYKSNGPATYYQTGSGTHLWLTAPSGTAGNAITFTQAMTLDSSGNLGIGTSSPGAKLDVAGSAGLAVRALASVGYNSSSNVRFDIGASNSDSVNNSATYAWKVETSGDASGQALTFSSYRRSDTTLERMRLDSSGNLGLGVTPSGWGSSYRAVQVAGQGSALVALTSAPYTYLGSNWLNDGVNNKYVVSAAAGLYRINESTHVWFTAPSGTAGNAITFTQAMTLDASGNLLVGTTLNGAGARLKSKVAAGTFGLEVTDEVQSDFIVAPLSGAVCRVGPSAGAMAFYSANTERARITSGGDLLVGATAQISNERLSVTATSTNQALYTKNNSTDYNFNCWNAATTGDNPFIQFITETAATSRGGITYNRAGGLVAYNITSDYRAKDIIGPLTDSGAVIDALKVYEGVMKGATQSRPMLIAHEAQAHAPYAVSGVKDEVNENGTPKFQQMDVSSLVPLLLAEIQSLRQRVALLEGN